MTASTPNGRAESGTRAGGYALSLLAVPINVLVIRALLVQPRFLAELRQEAGSVPQTTLRKHLNALAQLGVVSKRRCPEFPGALLYELTDSGRELVEVSEVLQKWLTEVPGGPHALGSMAAKSVIKALVDGWSANVIRALAARPLSLTELDAVISSLSYPSLERRLAAMRMAGQVEAAPGPGRGTPYAITDSLRRSVAPMAVAARWERRHGPAAAAPIARLDMEAAFLMSVPLLRLSPDLSGLCRLAVEIGNRERRMAGVLVDIEAGKVVSCVAALKGKATAWASGPSQSWLLTVIDAERDRLEVGGDGHLAQAVLGGLHEVLFGREKAPEPATAAHDDV